MDYSLVCFPHFHHSLFAFHLSHTNPNNLFTRMFFKIWNFVLVTVFSSVLSLENANEQTFTFFKSANVEEGRKSFTGNIKNISSEFNLWCSKQQGIWLFYSEPNFGLNSSYYGLVKTPRSFSNKSKGVCKELPLINLDDTISSRLQIQSVRHMSHANITIPALSLFTKVGDLFQKELFLDGQQLSLPEPKKFAAFGFSGFHNWTLFSEVGFNGRETCLTLPLDYQPNEEVDKMQGLLSVGLDVNLRVGSIKKGCTGNEMLFQNPLNSSATVYRENINYADELYSETPKERLNFNYIGERDRVELNDTEIPYIMLTLETVAEGDGLWMQDKILSDTQSLEFWGTELVLPEPVNMIQVRYYKGDEWDICTDLDFTGVCKCFKGKDDSQFDDGLQLEGNQSIKVMSLKYGCETSSGFLISANLRLFVGIFLFLEQFY